MKITYEKQYQKIDFNNFTLYSNLSINSTNVFYEYYNLVKSFSAVNKKEILQKIKEYKQSSKSKIRISYSKNEVEFFKPSKYIFPEFYIIFKN